jgi:YVTN family beta-propeller protein
MRRLVVLCLALVGCGRSFDAKDIQLTIAPAATVSDAELATVKSLDIAVVGDASATMTYPLSRPLSRNEHVVVHFTAAKGHVTVSVLARDAQSLIALRGNSGAVDLEVGGAHTAQAQLSPLASGMHQASAINLVPAQYTLFTGQTLQLGTDGEPVTWSCSDATVDANGLFTAPMTAGTVAVQAKSQLYPTDQGTVTLNVLATGVARFVGPLGGQGSVDGTGGAARINQVPAMVLDPSGIIYFTDRGNVVRKLDPATGVVTTIAGRPDYSAPVDGAGAAAGFNVIGGLASDGNGTLYVADSGCPCLRAVAVATGQTTTVAGKPQQFGSMDGVGAAVQMNWPNGLAWDSSKKLLYFAEDALEIIRTFDPATGKVTTIAGVPYMRGATNGPGAMATFNEPNEIVLDGNTLYIHEQSNQTIRALALDTKIVSPLWTNLQTSAMTSGGPGKLLVSTPIRTLDVAANSITPLTPTGSMYDPSLLNDWYNAFVLAPDGTLYATDWASFHHFDVATATRTIIAGVWRQWSETEGPRAAANISSFSTFAVRGDGAIFGADNRIFRIDADGKLTTVTPDPIGHPAVETLGQMAFAADGMLYATSWKYQTVVRVDVDHGGMVTTIAGKQGTNGYADGVGTAAQFNGIDSVAADGNKLYVTEQTNNVVRAIDLATAQVTTLAGTAQMCGYVDMPGSQARFCGLTGIVADGNGALYVTSNNTVRKIVIATGAVSTLAGNGTSGFVDGAPGTARFWNPMRLTIDPAKQYLYVSDGANDAIRRVEIATGNVTTVAGGPGKTQVVEGPLPGAVNQPGTLAFAATGELLVAVPREQNLLQIRLP